MLRERCAKRVYRDYGSLSASIMSWQKVMRKQEMIFPFYHGSLSLSLCCCSLLIRWRCLFFLEMQRRHWHVTNGFDIMCSAIREKQKKKKFHENIHAKFCTVLARLINIYIIIFAIWILHCFAIRFWKCRR